MSWKRVYDSFKSKNRKQSQNLPDKSSSNLPSSTDLTRKTNLKVEDNKIISTAQLLNIMRKK
ncbi:hypothetical protein SAMN05444392_11226 [Seinonella peptonophila]|uniref:Uncharacterized protein n=1 Tax=Seinonella peptonophila TaxID=112248 RepID=A0A1M5A6S0_9BACL|nr:hypothetical protein [Seinonella peptonophila]SHF25522.1 hypothetical protein SAMN05444392_11226 [Seinonella peptonophila]